MLSVVLAAIRRRGRRVPHPVRRERRERRDKDAVLAVGIFLVICADLLLLLEVLLDPGQLIGETPTSRQV